jgi:DNA (cytosine-5)-methyltransferase 3A
MRVLSLFDGCGMCYQALKDIGVEVSEYYASEVDKFAIEIALKNHPDIVELGDITLLDDEKLASLGSIDLLCAGFPCTSLSIAARQKESGLEKGQSTLFYEALRVIKAVKPKYFLVENVASMKNTDRDKISEALGVEPIMINSALLTAQSRKRYYWTNIPNVSQPEDRGILLKDIIESGFTERHKALCVTASYSKVCANDYFLFGNRQLIFTKPVLLGGIGNKPYPQGQRVYSINGKSVTLSANGGGRGAKTGLYEMKGIVSEELKPFVRRLSTTECEKLQGLPEGYTEGVSETQRYKMIGNGFTVPVIAHILNHIEEAAEHV